MAHLDEAPAALTMQIAKHWETYRPKMSRALKAEGLFEETTQAAALLTSDATYSLMTEHGLSPDQARELMREEWAFLPSEEDVPHLGVDPRSLPSIAEALLEAEKEPESAPPSPSAGEPTPPTRPQTAPPATPPTTSASPTPTPSARAVPGRRPAAT